jgi:hypothetical protein
MFPRGGIGGSYGSSLLSYLGSLHTAFLSGCTNLLIPECFFSPHPHQHLVLLLFWMVAILSRVRWNQCDCDLHFLFGQGCWVCLQVFLTRCISSFENFLFSSFAHFFTVSSILGSLVFEHHIDFAYSRSIAGKGFLPFWGLPLQFDDHFLCCAKGF